MSEFTDALVKEWADRDYAELDPSDSSTLLEIDGDASVTVRDSEKGEEDSIDLYVNGDYLETLSTHDEDFAVKFAEILSSNLNF